MPSRLTLAFIARSDGHKGLLKYRMFYSYIVRNCRALAMVESGDCRIEMAATTKLILL